MKKSIITIGGDPGSGKSSTAKGVAAALGYTHSSSGDLFRKMAADRGISVENINLTAEVQKEIDYEVDEWLQKMYLEQDNIVLDSRLAFHWMPKSFKVYLLLDEQTSAERIFSHIQREGRVSEGASSLDEVLRSIKSRAASEHKRYLSLYNVDPTDPHHFDVVINTNHNDLKTVTNMVLAAFEAWNVTT